IALGDVRLLARVLHADIFAVVAVAKRGAASLRRPIFGLRVLPAIRDVAVVVATVASGLLGTLRALGVVPIVDVGGQASFLSHVRHSWYLCCVGVCSVCSETGFPCGSLHGSFGLSVYLCRITSVSPFRLMPRCFISTGRSMSMAYRRLAPYSAGMF